MLIIVIICLITPLLIACFSYLLIWREKRKRTLRSLRQNQEARFSRTIFLVTAASFIAWMPFSYFNSELYMATGVPRLNIPLTAFFFIKLLHFSNSFVNFIIYIVRFPSYGKALFSLCRSYCVLWKHPSVRNFKTLHAQATPVLWAFERTGILYLFLPMKSDVFLNFRSMENVLSHLNGTSLKLIDI